jgi:hypothetical protein
MPWATLPNPKATTTKNLLPLEHSFYDDRKPDYATEVALF